MVFGEREQDQEPLEQSNKNVFVPPQYIDFSDHSDSESDVQIVPNPNPSAQKTGVYLGKRRLQTQEEGIVWATEQDLFLYDHEEYMREFEPQMLNNNKKASTPSKVSQVFTMSRSVFILNPQTDTPRRDEGLIQMRIKKEPTIEPSSPQDHGPDQSSDKSSNNSRSESTEASNQTIQR